RLAAWGGASTVALALVLCGVAGGVAVALLDAMRPGSLGLALSGTAAGLGVAVTTLLPMLGERATSALASALTVFAASGVWIATRSWTGDPARAPAIGSAARLALAGCAGWAAAVAAERITVAVARGSGAGEGLVTPFLLAVVGGVATSAAVRRRSAEAATWAVPLVAGAALAAATAPTLICPAVGSGRVLSLALAGAVAWSPARWRRCAGWAVALASFAIPAEVPLRWLSPGLEIESVRETGAGIALIAGTGNMAPGARRLELAGERLASDAPESLAHRALLGQAPLLLHSDPRRVLLVGTGSSVTAAALAEGGPDRLVVVEPSGAVLDLAGSLAGGDTWRNFSGLELRAGAFAAPSFIPGAGWDVVVLDTLAPNRPGGAARYSKESLLAVRAALAPDGVLALRVPLDEVTDFSMSLLLRAVWEVMPGVSLWHAAGALEPSVVLTATAQPRPLRVRWPALEPPRLSPSLAAAGIAGAETFACALLVAPPGASYLVEGEEPLSDDLPIVEAEVPRRAEREQAHLFNLRSLYAARARSTPFADAPLDWARAVACRDRRLIALLRELGARHRPR
ncbi:MAG: spermidine synthase, partial [Acidobacteriota bacterium]